MHISGLQKLTLLDYPGKMACTVFTSGCNLRCPFCHNASLVLPETVQPLADAQLSQNTPLKAVAHSVAVPGVPDALSEADFFAFLQKRQGLLDGVCVTGGEPLLQPDLAAFLQKIRASGFLVKLDTNGTFPQQLRELVEGGLVDYVAMDLKNSPAHYAKTTGVPGLNIASLQESVRFLMQGHLPFEFRTTCVRGLHTAADFSAMAEWIAGAPQYFLQGFVDSGDLIAERAAPGAHAACPDLSAFSRKEMDGFLALVQEKVPAAQLRGV